MRYKKKKKTCYDQQGASVCHSEQQDILCPPVSFYTSIHPSIHRHKTYITHICLSGFPMATNPSQTNFALTNKAFKDTEAHLICNFILTSVCLFKGVHAGEIDSQCLKGGRQAEPALWTLYPHAGDSGAAILPLSAHFTTRHPQTPIRTLKKGSRCV